jgi:hypothetical protein
MWSGRSHTYLETHRTSTQPNNSAAHGRYREAHSWEPLRPLKNNRRQPNTPTPCIPGRNWTPFGPRHDLRAITLPRKTCHFAGTSSSRGDRIRTCDRPAPSRVRYQTAPLPVALQAGDGNRTRPRSLEGFCAATTLRPQAQSHLTGVPPPGPLSRSAARDAPRSAPLPRSPPGRAAATARTSCPAPRRASRRTR